MASAVEKRQLGVIQDDPGIRVAAVTGWMGDRLDDCATPGSCQHEGVMTAQGCRLDIASDERAGAATGMWQPRAGRGSGRRA